MQELALKHRELIFQIDDFGQSPLHVAAKRRLDEIAAFIVIENGPINLMNSSGQRPIDVAIKTENVDLVKVYNSYLSFF